MPILDIEYHEPDSNVRFTPDRFMGAVDWVELLEQMPHLYSYVHGLYMSIPDIHDWFDKAQQIMYGETGILMWRCMDRINYLIVDHQRYLVWDLSQ